MTRYFGLVFTLSLPFWLAGNWVQVRALPGLPIVDVFIVLCPLGAAVLLTYRDRGTAGVERLLKAAVVSRPATRRWYVASLLIVPAATELVFLWMRVTGALLPPAQIGILSTALLFVGFVIGAACEEVGWTGYATRALRQSRSLVTTALIIGGAEASWHFIQLAQIGRSAGWIAWWSVWTIAARVLMVWLYDATGSVLSAVLFHASMNLSWQLFPHAGSHWDPRPNGALLAVVAAVVCLIRTRTRTGHRRTAISVIDQTQ